MVSSCVFRQTLDFIIVDKPFILDQKEIVIQCQPPIIRSRNSGSILISIEEQWSAAPPWKQIKLKNGVWVTLNVILIGDGGKEYQPNVFGSATGEDGKAIDVRFAPQIPENIKINSIRLRASSKLLIKKIIWHEFDPK